MYQVEDDAAVSPSAPFPVIRGLLRHRRAVVAAGACLPLLLMAWVAWRTGVPDFYVAGVLVGAAAYGVLKIAIEVVELVAETLMPR